MNGKPQLALAAATLLRAQVPIADLEPVQEGLESQAFASTLDGVACIARINPQITGFEKDRYAFEHFGGPSLPVPPVLALGWLDESHAYCVTRRAPGVTAEAPAVGSGEHIAAATFACWLAMGEVDISATTGFGPFDATGHAAATTWRSHLLEASRLSWDGLQRADASLVEALSAQLEMLVDYCPEERRLIHRDFGDGNLIVDDDRVTGVIDWGEAGYGDPLYDIACGHFWGVWVPSLGAFACYADAQLAHLPQY